jgi:hypothetical protein
MRERKFVYFTILLINEMKLKSDEGDEHALKKAADGDKCLQTSYDKTKTSSL